MYGLSSAAPGPGQGAPRASARERLSAEVVPASDGARRRPGGRSAQACTRELAAHITGMLQQDGPPAVGTDCRALSVARLLC